MLRSILFLLVASTLLPAQKAELTITNSNLAMVKETRQLQLKQGNQIVRIPDIALQIIPASVRLQDAGFSIIDQRFRYDVADLPTLLRRSTGNTISIIMPSGETVRGVLEAFNNNRMFLRLDDNHLRGITLSSELQIDFESLSATPLQTAPHLQWNVFSAKENSVQPQLSYLTRGMNWQAEYNAIIAEDQKTITLSSWAVIDNNCGRSFQNAGIKLLAGDIRTLSSQPTPAPYLQRSMAKVMDAEMAAPNFSEQSVSEFHLYTLDQPGDINDNEQVQFRLLHHTQLAAKKQLSYNYQKSAEQVSVEMELKNTSEKPLPAGLVRLYQNAGGSSEFIGETSIGHTAKNAKIRLNTGKAFDIKAERKLLNRNRIGKNSEKQDIEITFRNYKNSAITILVTEPVPGYRIVKIMNSSHELVEQDAGHLRFLVNVPAEDSAVLHLELLYNW